MPTNISVTPSSSPTTPVSVGLGDLATSPQRVRTDEGTVEERPIDQLLQADTHQRLDQDKSVIGAGNLFGCAVARTRPSDTLGTQRRDPYGPRFL